MSTVLVPQPVGRPWFFALAAVAAAWAAIVGLYFETFAGMQTIWERSPTFTHGYLVLPISLWLMWRRRAVLAALRLQPQPVWLAALAAAGLIWLLGDLAGVNAVVQFAATAMLVLAVPAVLGPAVARALAFPLAFLFFMVPVGEFMMPQLMQWTADFAVAALRLVGIPVYREGLQFMIPSGSWSVIESCSGVRYVIASLMVGTLFAYLNYRSTWRRLTFIGVSLVVPIVANWLRAFMIVMIGHLSGNTLAVGVDHLIYGWIFFGVVVMLMFAIGARWSEPPADAGGEVAPTTPGDSRSRLQLGRVAATLALLLAFVLLPHRVSASLRVAGAVAPDLELPALSNAPDATPDTDYRPLFEAPSAQATRSYAYRDAVITVHAAYYRNQTYGRKLGSSQNKLVNADDKRWATVHDAVGVVAVGTQTVPMRDAVLRAGAVEHAGTDSTRLVVRQVLWVDGKLTTSRTEAVLQMLLAQLRGRGDDSAALTLYCASANAAEAAARLDAFITEHLPALVAALEAARHKTHASSVPNHAHAP